MPPFEGGVAYGVLLSKSTQVLSDVTRLPPGLLIAVLPNAETGHCRKIAAIAVILSSAADDISPRLNPVTTVAESIAVY
jgi:hypothetical protein